MKLSIYCIDHFVFFILRIFLVSLGKSENFDFLSTAFNLTYGTKYSRMDQVKFFKGCLPQNKEFFS